MAKNCKSNFSNFAQLDGTQKRKLNSYAKQFAVRPFAQDKAQAILTLDQKFESNDYNCFVAKVAEFCFEQHKITCEPNVAVIITDHDNNILYYASNGSTLKQLKTLVNIYSDSLISFEMFKKADLTVDSNHELAIAIEVAKKYMQRPTILQR